MNLWNIQDVLNLLHKHKLGFMVRVTPKISNWNRVLLVECHKFSCLQMSLLQGLSKCRFDESKMSLEVLIPPPLQFFSFRFAYLIRERRDEE